MPRSHLLNNFQYVTIYVGSQVLRDWQHALEGAGPPATYRKYKMNIRIDAKITTAFLFSILALLVFGHFFSVIMAFRFDYHNDVIFDYINLDDEENLSTFFSASMLLFSSLLLFVIFAFHRQDKNGEYKYWLALALLFLFLAIDESSKVHEKVIDAYWTLFGQHENSKADNYIWVIAYGGFALVIAAVYLRFVLSQPRKTCLLIFVAAALYVGGALGMEVIGALYVDQSYFRESATYDFSRFNGKYFLISGTEESMEMLGVLTFIYTLLAYIEMKWRGLYIINRPSGGEASPS